MFVGNLEKEIDEEQLRRCFSNFGTVTSVKLMRHKTSVSKGHGFVSFATPGEAALAVSKMRGQVIIKNPLRVAPQRTKLEQRAIKERQYLYVPKKPDVSVVTLVEDMVMGTCS